jgi:hypothetical protein
MGNLANPPDPSVWNTPAREKNGVMYWSRCICVATEIVNTKLVQHVSCPKPEPLSPIHKTLDCIDNGLAQHAKNETPKP